MSNTSNLDPKRLIILYSGSVLSIVAGGKHRRFVEDEVGKEFLTKIYETARNFKEHGDPESREKLEQFLQPDFRMEDEQGYLRDFQGNYYLHQTPHVPLYPAVKKMIDQYNEESLDPEPILNLWKLSLNNPNEQAREDLMSYIEQYGVPVTDNGYMILYKAVRDKNEVVEKLSYFVGQEFFEARRHREDPSTVYIYDLDEYAQEELGAPSRFFAAKNETITVDGEMDGEWEDEDTSDPVRTNGRILQPLGTLQELFEDLVLNKKDIDPDEKEEEPVFEPYHRGDYGMTIKLGEVVTMPREECDPNINRECSYGLHVGSYEYVSKFGNHKETTLACLVNPSDIVALPQYDNSKIRVCAYLPYGVIKKDEDGNWEEAETTYWEENFIDYEVSSLEQRIEELEAQMENKEGAAKASLEELVSVAKERLVHLNK